MGPPEGRRFEAGDGLHAPVRQPVVVPARDKVGRLEIGHEPRDHVEQAAHRVDRRAVGPSVGGEVPGPGPAQRRLAGLPGAVDAARQAGPVGGRASGGGGGPRRTSSLRKRDRVE